MRLLAYFGYVLDPFTPTVTERVDLSLQDFSANRAGTRFLPFLGTTGGGSYHPRASIVTECRDLRISRIVAARASIVRFPTVFGTGSRLFVVMHEVVTERRNNGIG